jgi:hypothetical protein
LALMTRWGEGRGFDHFLYQLCLCYVINATFANCIGLHCVYIHSRRITLC